jgi:hypothetical protein
VDVILILRRRYDRDKYEKCRQIMVSASGRRFSNILEELFYP